MAFLPRLRWRAVRRAKFSQNQGWFRSLIMVRRRPASSGKIKAGGPFHAITPGPCIEDCIISMTYSFRAKFDPELASDAKHQRHDVGPRTLAGSIRVMRAADALGFFSLTASRATTRPKARIGVRLLGSNDVIAAPIEPVSFRSIGATTCCVRVA